MFQQLAARAARPVAGTVATAAAAATATPGSAPAPALADASYRDRPAHQFQAAVEASSEPLTVFSGAKRGSINGSGLEEHEVWSLVDSQGDISVEEVRIAAQPVLAHLQSPPSGDDSDGFEAESVMHRTEAIINNVTELLNDPAFMQMARNHKAMKEMIATMKTGPLLLPDLAVPLRSTVRIEELDDASDADIKSPIEQLAEGLKFVGDRLGKVWNGIGDFFKGVAAKVTRKDKDGEPPSWDEQIFNVMFTLAVLVLVSIVAKRVVVRR